MKWLSQLKRTVKSEAQAEPTLQTTQEVLSAADGQAVSGLSPREAEVFRRLLDGANAL